MKELIQLRALIDDLQKRRVAFKQQLSEFQSLQSEIAGLQERAHCDPAARKKLQKLDEAMLGGGYQLHQQIIEKIAKVERSFGRLGEQLRQLSPGDDAPLKDGVALSKPGAKKKYSRIFF